MLSKLLRSNNFLRGPIYYTCFNQRTVFGDKDGIRTHAPPKRVSNFRYFSRCSQQFHQTDLVAQFVFQTFMYQSREYV